MTDQRLQDLYQHALAARQAGERGECPSPEQLLALARREGGEEERLRTLDHTMSCADCMRELDLLRAIEKTGARMQTNQGAPRREVTSWRRAVPLALAASLVLAVSLVVRERSSKVSDVDLTRGAGAELVVHSPRDLQLRSGDSLSVAWRPAPGATRFTLEVLDDDGRVAFSQTTTDTTVVVRDLGRLVPGRMYRWWVRGFGASGAQATSSLGRLRVISQ